jgi:hypothetical protein
MLPSNAADFEKGGGPAQQRKRPEFGGLIVTVILVVVLIAIIGLAVTRLSGATLSVPGLSRSPTQGVAAKPSGTSTAAQTPVVQGTPADAATQQAIQQVIQQVNMEQVQAVEGNDPTVMQPTATPQFYQQQVATNQDLENSGVTDIKLENIEWGPITVDGATATATDFETWSTTFDDGTTEQSRDRNVYTLVNENGTWKVQADDHPDEQTQGQAPGGGGQTPAAPVTP